MISAAGKGMRKKIKRIRIKQNAKDIGVCFEPLEPRLLLSGSWGAGVDAPSSDSQQNTHGGFAQETVVFSKNTVGSGADALIQNQSVPESGALVDVLAQTSPLNAFAAAGPVPKAPSTLDQTATITGDTPSNGTERAPDLQTDRADEAGVRELVFVNDNVAGYEKFIADLQRGDDNRGFEVVVLDSDRDGIEQVSEILADWSDLTAVHFITHGANGQINLGNSWLNGTALQLNSNVVAGWGRALTDNGDILFYGCSIAADSAGQTLLGDLADLTGADVAASKDLTGHTSLSGDWVLEYQAGTVETGIALSMSAEDDWVGVLATFTVTSVNDSGAGTLRQAITDANTNAGADTIAFNIAGTGVHTITPTSALPTITGQVTIDGYTQTGASVNTLATGDNAVLTIELNGTGAGSANGLTLGAGSDGSTIRGLVINRFSLSGIQINSTNNLIFGNFSGTDSTGTVDLGNTLDGITVSGNSNTIGGSAPADRNLFSGNNDEGVDVDPGFIGNDIIGNYIGTNASGTSGVGNGTGGNSGGICIDGSNTRVGGINPGEGNLIAYNNPYGIFWSTPTTVGVSILGNSIFSNASLGIDLGINGVTPNDAGDADTGENNLQNFPVLTSANSNTAGTTIVGTLNTNVSITTIASNSSPTGRAWPTRPMARASATLASSPSSPTDRATRVSTPRWPTSGSTAATGSPPPPPCRRAVATYGIDIRVRRQRHGELHRHRRRGHNERQLRLRRGVGHVPSPISAITGGRRPHLAARGDRRSQQHGQRRHAGQNRLHIDGTGPHTINVERAADDQPSADHRRLQRT